MEGTQSTCKSILLVIPHATNRSDYPKIGLKGTAIASSFGKVFKTPADERSKFKQEDISRSMLVSCGDGG